MAPSTPVDANQGPRNNRENKAESDILPTQTQRHRKSLSSRLGLFRDSSAAPPFRSRITFITLSPLQPQF